MQSKLIIGLIGSGLGALMILGLYFYEWFSTHSTEYIKSLEERCKDLEIQVKRLSAESKQKGEKVASLLTQNERLELSLSENDIELHLALKRKDEEIQKLMETIEILRKTNDDMQFESDWERSFGNRNL